MSTIEDLLPYAGAAIVLAPVIFFGARATTNYFKQRKAEQQANNALLRIENYAEYWIEHELPMLVIDLANAGISPIDFFGRSEFVLGGGINNKYFRGTDPEANRELLETYLEEKPMERRRFFNLLEKRVEVLKRQKLSEIT